MAKITLDFKLLGAGWIQATVAAGGQCAAMTVSYLSDALDQLTRVTVALLQGAEEARCTWEDEPGEYRWLLVRKGETLGVTLRRFEETFSRKRDDQGADVFTVECELLRFATQLKGQLHQLLNEFGEQGYRERWKYDFPAGKFAELQEQIAQRKRRPAS